MSTDPLTGALQRGALEPAFATACSRATSVGLLLLDLDHFKSVNDAFGHAAGDAVLREFGARARAVLRSEDILIRYGGDEFVVLLPNAALATAQEVAARLLAHVSSHPFPGTPPLTVTLSIGCAGRDITTGDLSLDALMARADTRLYQAKRGGRNRVVSSEEGPPASRSQVAAADAQGRLLERDAAYTQMLAWLDALSGGDRGILRVFGAPGVGMTRFLRAVESTARLRGYQVMALTGGVARRLRHYGALAEALGDLGDGDLADLERLLASIQPARAGGLLVIVDRVSQVDTATLGILWQVVGHPTAERVGLVVGLSPGLVEMGWLPDLPVRAEVRLHPLSVAGLQVWLRGALHWEAPAELSTWLHELTDGYPALFQAGLSQLVADRVLTPLPEGSGWQVSPFFQEYPLRDWLHRARAREEEASRVVQPYGQLIGRNAELRALKQALAEQHLVVLAGHGGVGKTHLALQAAAELGPQFADGIVVVPLAATTALEFVAFALAHALGLLVAGHQEPITIVRDYVMSHELLLVLDAVDHLPGVDALVQDLLAAPRGRILVTTRKASIVAAPLVITLQGLRTETAPVESTPADPPLGGAPHFSPGGYHLVTSASDLFLQASGLTSPNALPAQESLTTIGHITGLVQGYPLAIKMLASWTTFFGYQGIADRLARHVQGRTSEAPENDVETAGSPMQAVFDFFWSLLSGQDRQCVGGVALFRGGFTVEAAFDIAGATPFLLAALRDRAFVQIDAAGRYYLHELLRQYAWAWLQHDSEATAAIEEGHAAWYARLAAVVATEMRGPHFRQWVDRLESEIDNLRGALAWALTHAPLQALQAALDLTEFWLAGLHPGEGRGWIETAMARAEACPDGLPLALRVRALGRLGRLDRQLGDTDTARLHVTTAVTLAAAEAAPSDHELAYSLGTLANIESDVGAHEQAVWLAHQALDRARRLESPRDIAITCNMAVWPFVFAGALADATQIVEEGLQASAACGDHRSAANLTNAKATITYYDLSRHDEAIRLYQQVIDLYAELGDWSGLLLAFNNLASVYLDNNQFERAGRAFADARRIGHRVKQHRMMPNVLSGSGIVASVRGDDVAAWGFWKEALALAHASSNMLILEECAIGLAYVWARAGFAAPAAVLIGMIGLEPPGKPWLRPHIERASGAARPALSAARWEILLAHGTSLDLSETARLLLTRGGPYDVPDSLLPAYTER